MQAKSPPGQAQQQPDIKRLQCLEHHHVATSAKTGKHFAPLSAKPFGLLGIQMWRLMQARLTSI
jgi:hypothetical protein